MHIMTQFTTGFSGSFKRKWNVLLDINKCTCTYQNRVIWKVLDHCVPFTSLKLSTSFTPWLAPLSNHIVYIWKVPLYTFYIQHISCNIVKEESHLDLDGYLHIPVGEEKYFVYKEKSEDNVSETLRNRALDLDPWPKWPWPYGS